MQRSPQFLEDDARGLFTLETSSTVPLRESLFRREIPRGFFQILEIDVAGTRVLAAVSSFTNALLFLRWNVTDTGPVDVFFRLNASHIFEDS